MLMLTAIREYLRSSLWFIPAIFAFGAIALSVVMTSIDRLLPEVGAVFGGTAEGARSVLSTIAQSMLTFTALVFTVTMLVLQLASSQLSPRVMRTYLRDRGVQSVLGLFVATLLYTLLVLREIRSPVGDVHGFVPGASISAAFILLLASVGAFVYYIDHMAHSVRATTVMDSVVAETRRTIDRVHPDEPGPDEPDVVADSWDRTDDPNLILCAKRDGYLVGLDETALLELVQIGDRRAELVPMVGDAVVEGERLFRLWGAWDPDDAARLSKAVSIGPDRTARQDVGFGLRQLVDIALRALSPAINDPTTAVQTIDRIHGLLRRLAARGYPAPITTDDGTPRIIIRWLSWPDYLQLATEEIALAGATQPAVTRRLHSMLADLSSVTTGDRRLAVWAAVRRIPHPAG